MTTRVPTYVPMDDTCAWCKHDIKVAVRTWEMVKSQYSWPICANYCNDKTCKSEGCTLDCGDVALSTPENEEKMLHEISRKRRKFQRLETEAEGQLRQKTAVAADKSESEVSAPTDDESATDE